MSDTADIVYVIDDDESVRSSLHNLINSAGFAVEVFADAQSYLTSPRPDCSTCLVLDVRMPGLSGLELQKRLQDSSAGVPIVFLTGNGDIPMSVEAMKYGAVTFLTKPVRPPELLSAIRDGLARDRAARAERMDLTDLRQRYRRLTRRERDVMAGVVAGKLNKQIAADFGTTEATVKEQRAHVMAKMRASSIADLVRQAARLDARPSDAW